MSKEYKKHHDMSVEDILQSIRNVIEGSSNVTEVERVAFCAKKNVDDVLELTEVVDDGKITAAENDNHDYVAEESDDQDHDESVLLSQEVASETSELLKGFAQAARHFAKEDKKTSYNPTVEDFVAEIVRPQLKKWLDEHLPAIVKDLVSKEIKRIMPDDIE